MGRPPGEGSWRETERRGRVRRGGAPDEPGVLPVMAAPCMGGGDGEGGDCRWEEPRSGWSQGEDTRRVEKLASFLAVDVYGRRGRRLEPFSTVDGET